MRYLCYVLLVALTLSICAALTGCNTVLPVPEAPKPVAKALSWEIKHPERADWSHGLKLMLKPHIGLFGAAEDINEYCPGFKDKSPEVQLHALAEMFVKISKFESAWNPRATYQEPPPPRGPGTLSIGLFQMSYGDGSGCPNKTADGDLYKPLPNIECAVKKAVVLLKKDKVVAVKKLGMSRYWSVTRDGHHKLEIRAHVKGFCL